MKRLVFCLLAVAFGVEAAEYQLTTIASGLDAPWGLAFPPAGGVLVTEQVGALRYIASDGTVSEPIAGVPDVHYRSQGGLFDVLLHPEFARNQILYLSYAALPAGANATEVMRARWTDDGLVEKRVIFRVAPDKPTPVHYGGRMRFLADGTILLTTGDGFDFRESAQNTSSLLGKTVRFNDDGSIPEDNPFVNDPSAHPAVYSFGHRNPQGLVIDPVTQIIYLNEHGPRGGDETNVIEPGANYGWPAITYGMDYNGAYVSAFSEAPGMQQPLNYWVPSIAPSGLTIYRGSRFPQWDGDLFTGALVDAEVRRLDLQNGKVVDEEALFAELGARIRDVRTHDGYLYVVTDGIGGKIVRVEPAP
ncbi:MAG: PQQ-dependent sugar dehydrogenase [Proteobacteria bacterium]|nr:PQQ-dependent sugar dehydrogenase [Pseudomonadota bacterium]